MSELNRVFFIRSNFLCLFCFITCFLALGFVDLFLVASISYLTASLAGSTSSLFSFLISELLQTNIKSLCLILLVLSFSLKLFGLYYQGKVCFRAANIVATKIYGSCVGRNPRFYSEHDTAELTSRATVKVSQISYNVFYPMLNIIAICLSAGPISIVLLFAFPVQFGLIFFVFVFIVFLTKVTFGKKLRKNANYLNEKTETLTRRLSFDFNNFFEIGLAKSLVSYFSSYQIEDQKFREKQRQNQYLNLLPRQILEVSATIFGVLVIFNFNGDNPNMLLTYGAGFAVIFQKFLPYISNVNSSVATIWGNQAFLNDTQKFLENLKSDKFDLPGDSHSVELAGFIYKNESNFNSRESDSGDFSICSLGFKNISYSWGLSRDLVISNLSFSLEKGDVVGVFGPSGSGKTTLAALIAALSKPDSGQIIVNGKTVGLDIPYTKFRDRIFMCSQIPHIYFGTVYKNVVANTLENVDKKNVRDALDKVNLSKDFGANLNYCLQEGGRNISGGQRMRIGIARAIFSQRDLIIFDEPTAGLDSSNAKQIIEQILANFHDKIVIIITHDRSLKNKFNKLIQYDKKTAKFVLS